MGNLHWEAETLRASQLRQSPIHCVLSNSISFLYFCSLIICLRQSIKSRLILWYQTAQTVDKLIFCADGQHFCLWQKLRKRSRIYLCDAPVRKTKSFPSLIRRSTNRVKVAARSVPKGNLRTCHGDRAHISGKTADRKRSLCKQSDNGRGEWRVSKLFMLFEKPME